MSVHRLEELSSGRLDQLDRQRTAVIITVSPLEHRSPFFAIPFFRTNAWWTLAAGAAAGALSAYWLLG